jgi:hypothetical protein
LNRAAGAVETLSAASGHRGLFVSLAVLTSITFDTDRRVGWAIVASCALSSDGVTIPCSFGISNATPELAEMPGIAGAFDGYGSGAGVLAVFARVAFSALCGGGEVGRRTVGSGWASILGASARSGRAEVSRRTIRWLKTRRTLRTVEPSNTVITRSLSIVNLVLTGLTIKRDFRRDGAIFPSIAVVQLRPWSDDLIRLSNSRSVKAVVPNATLAFFHCSANGRAVRSAGADQAVCLRDCLHAVPVPPGRAWYRLDGAFLAVHSNRTWTLLFRCGVDGGVCVLLICTEDTEVSTPAECGGNGEPGRLTVVAREACQALCRGDEALGWIVRSRRTFFRGGSACHAVSTNGAVIPLDHSLRVAVVAR